MKSDHYSNLIKESILSKKLKNYTKKIKNTSMLNTPFESSKKSFKKVRFNL